MNSGGQCTSDYITNAITVTRPWQSQTSVACTSRTHSHQYIQLCQIWGQQMKVKVPWNLLMILTWLSRDVSVAVKVGQTLEPNDGDFCKWILSRRHCLQACFEACNQRHIYCEAKENSAVLWRVCSFDFIYIMCMSICLNFCLCTVFMHCPWRP